MNKLLPSLLLLAFVHLPFHANAQQGAPASARLRVVAKPAEPFVMQGKNGEINGYSVELWQRVAKEAGVEYDLKMLKTVPEVLEAVQKGEADLAIGALSITEEREKVMDFTQPFFDESGLQIAAHARSQGSALQAFASILKNGALKVVGLLILALFAVSHLLWLAERRKNPESYPEAYRQGVFESLWWSVSTMLTGGCENIAPRAFLGRLIGVVWMIGGIALTSYITATMAAAMTVNTLTSEIRNLGDLQGQTVGTVSGTSAEAYLKALSYEAKGYGDINAAMDALQKGDVKAVVYDSPILRYYLSNHSGTDLQVVGSIFEKQAYGFALPLGSPLRKRINQALLKPGIEQFHDELDKRWFAAAAKDSGD